MGVSLEVIKQLTIQARAEGVDAARGELDRLATSQQGVAVSSDRMRIASENM